jgi:hypothetical protein
LGLGSTLNAFLASARHALEPGEIEQSEFDRFADEYRSKRVPDVFAEFKIRDIADLMACS